MARFDVHLQCIFISWHNFTSLKNRSVKYQLYIHTRKYIYSCKTMFHWDPIRIPKIFHKRTRYQQVLIGLYPKNVKHLNKRLENLGTKNFQKTSFRCNNKIFTSPRCAYVPKMYNRSRIKVPRKFKKCFLDLIFIWNFFGTFWDIKPTSTYKIFEKSLSSTYLVLLFLFGLINIFFKIST